MKTLYDIAAAAKTRLEGHVFRTMAASSDLFLALPFTNIPGASYAYNAEAERDELVNPAVEVLKIIGENIRGNFQHVDAKAPNTTNVPMPLGYDVHVQLNHIGHTLAHKFLCGDASKSRKDFYGLNFRIDQAYGVYKPDVSFGEQLKALVNDNATHILVGRKTYNRFWGAARAGELLVTLGPLYGKRVAHVLCGRRWVPVLKMEFYGCNRCLVENATYAIRLGDGGFCMLQNGDPEVCLVNSASQLRLEWLVSPVCLGNRSVRMMKEVDLRAPLVTATPTEISKPDYAAITRAIVGR